jgi:hypothetical protein
MWILIISAVLVVFVLLEAKRQEKKYGPVSGKGDLMRTGLLELHRHLQADRKVEIMLDEEKNVPEQVTSDDPFKNKTAL